MNENEKDILTSRKELKEMPYGVPDGYFETFRTRMSETKTPEKSGKWRRTMPYLAAAASAALLITLGATFMGRPDTEEDYSLEDYILFSDSLISTDDESGEQMAEAGLQDEEIIEYLIYIGISPETIELSE